MSNFTRSVSVFSCHESRENFIAISSVRNPSVRECPRMNLSNKFHKAVFRHYEVFQTIEFFHNVIEIW